MEMSQKVLSGYFSYLTRIIPPDLKLKFRISLSPSYENEWLHVVFENIRFCPCVCMSDFVEIGPSGYDVMSHRDCLLRSVV